MQRLGYVRVSTGGQTEDSQVDQLTAVGVDRVFADRAVHGDVAPGDRPAMKELLGYARADDVLVTVDMTRLGRSAIQALMFMDQLANQRAMHVRTLREGIDTSGAHGKLMAHLFGAIAEWELALIRARTNEGIASARARGVRFGRPPAVSEAMRKEIIDKRAAGMTQRAIGELFRVGTTTVQRVLRDHEQQPTAPLGSVPSPVSR